MAKQKDFDTFLSNIEPKSSTISYISNVQNNLRDYLAEHEEYQDIHVQTFLSGSYAKHTSIRPKLNDGKRDVDIIVETSHGSDDDSCDVIQELLDTILEKSIYNNSRLQSHSVGIEMEGLEIDVVPVIRSEDNEIFCIGTSDVNEWILSDPKGHIKWSSTVNADNSNKYKPLVKIFKWWRRTNCPDDAKYPKGLALEKLIADNLPDSGLSTEDYLISTMRNIVDTYKVEYVDCGTMPVINDPCLEDNNLLENYTFSDFEAFIAKISYHLTIIDADGVSNDIWREILGTEFPKDTNSQSSSSDVTSLTHYDNTEHFIEEMFPCKAIYNLKIDCTITQNGFRPFSLLKFLRDGGFLQHQLSLDFFILSCDVPDPYSIYWKVRNVGKVAEEKNCIRGQINKTDNKHQNEHTNFHGPHYVECYIVKDGICVARDKISVPIK